MAVHLDHGKDELEEAHEINVTPFIDVMLVLLIIFMVAAPAWMAITTRALAVQRLSSSASRAAAIMAIFRPPPAPL